MATMKSTVGEILDVVSSGGYGGGSGVGMITAIAQGDGMALQAPAQSLYRGMEEGAILPLIILLADGKIEFDFITDVYEGENGLTFSTVSGKHYVAAQPTDNPTTSSGGGSTPK